MNPCLDLSPTEVLLGHREPETKRCRECGRFYDQRTGERIASPFVAVNVSEGVCKECYQPTTKTK